MFKNWYVLCTGTGVGGLKRNKNYGMRFSWKLLCLQFNIRFSTEDTRGVTYTSYTMIGIGRLKINRNIRMSICCKCLKIAMLCMVNTIVADAPLLAYCIAMSCRHGIDKEWYSFVYYNALSWKMVNLICWTHGNMWWWNFTWKHKYYFNL